MRQHDLKARPRRRRLPPDLGERPTDPVASNVLDRAFVTPAPNRRWSQTSPIIWMAEAGSTSRRSSSCSHVIVGSSMSAATTVQLVTDALEMAIWRRGKPEALAPPDRGNIVQWLPTR